MDFKEYTDLAARTDAEPNTLVIGADYAMLLNATMGLSGEAGECLEHMKKVLFQGHKLDKEKLKEEAGDALWYLAKLARYCDTTLEEIAAGNIEKLRKRYPLGFDSERSINREKTPLVGEVDYGLKEYRSKKENCYA